jgi:hypothetical protein
LYGKHSDRDNKISWYEREAVCPECYRKAQTDAASASAQAAGLPSLTGSEKQIAWAETIRKAVIDAINDDEVRITVAHCKEHAARIRSKFEALLASGIDRDAAKLEITQRLRDYATWLRQKSESRWWIDHRNLSASDLFCEWMRDAASVDFRDYLG